MFKDFLKSQHCSENLNFWLDVEKYKQANGDLRDSEAKRIYESYISIMSPTEVGIFLLCCDANARISQLLSHCLSSPIQS